MEDSKYTTTRRPLSTEEVTKYTNILEEVAFKVFNEIVKEVNDVKN